MITSITPCLWFDGKAEETANFYITLFPDSRIEMMNRSATDWPGGKAGDVLFVAFTLAGQPFSALNGGPFHSFSEAISLQVACETQDEIDRLWSALSAQPDAEMCGWCKDRYGLSWQIMPAKTVEWLSDPDSAARVMAEITSPMKKLDIARLEAAAKG